MKTVIIYAAIDASANISYVMYNGDEETAQFRGQNLCEKRVAEIGADTAIWRINADGRLEHKGKKEKLCGLPETVTWADILESYNYRSGADKIEGITIKKVYKSLSNMIILQRWLRTNSNNSQADFSDFDEGFYNFAPVPEETPEAVGDWKFASDSKGHWQVWRCQNGKRDVVYVGKNPDKAKMKIEKYLARKR